jgi:hypothetical protein
MQACQEALRDWLPAWETRCATAPVQLKELALLADVYHLPFSYSSEGTAMVQTIFWLQSSTKAGPWRWLFPLLLPLGVGGRVWVCLDERGATRAEHGWQAKADTVKAWCAMIHGLFDKLEDLASRELLCDMYPYIWSLNEVPCPNWAAASLLTLTGWARGRSLPSP